MPPIARRMIALTIALLCGAVLLASCAKKPVQSPPQPAAPPPVPHVETTPAPAPAPPPAPAPAVPVTDFRDVFFEYGQSNLDDRARAALDGDAQLLRDHPELEISIEGHCDERGTVEYNLSLGERRADAARDYLTAAGVSAGRIQTISYGKERPFCTESNESCWSKNRCAHFVLR